MVNGQWVAQNGAVSAAFSPLGDQFAVLSSKRLIVYDTDLQLPIVTHDIAADVCRPETEFFKGRKVRFSSDGETLFVDIDCESGTDKIVFFKAPASGTVPSTEPAPSGAYIYGQNGGYFAKSSTSVYIADQTDNQITHVNVARKTVIESFPLSAQPTELAYVESSNTLYVALNNANNLVKIALNTGVQSEIVIDAPVLSLAAHKDRVYFSSANATFVTDSELYSVGSDDIVQYHGGINGELIELNPITDEVISVETDRFSAAHRYSFDAAGTVVEQQVTDDLAADTVDLALSPDGQQLAVVSASGNGEGYTIHDFSGLDQGITNGAWDTGENPGSADFSPSGTLFAATNNSDLLVFDAARRTLISSIEIDVDDCPQYYDVLGKARFSIDGESVFVNLTCGSSGEHSTLFYYPVPSVPTPIAQPALTTNPASIGQLHYSLGLAGSYYAKSLSSVYVADQTNNRVIHTNVDADIDLAYFDLTDQPAELVFLASTNTLYVSLRAAGKLVKINLDSGLVSEIPIAARAVSMHAHNDRVYFTVNVTSQNFALYSVGSDNLPALHGEIKGATISVNPISSEIIAVSTNSSTTTIYRYSLDATNNVLELQASSDAAASVLGISVSPDGQQLAVGGFSGTGGSTGIGDILATDLTVSNGFWNNRLAPSSFSFSPNGATFAAVAGTSSVKLFDPLTHAEITTHNVDTDLCTLTNNHRSSDLKFSADGLHVVTKVVCDDNNAKTVLYFNSAQ